MHWVARNIQKDPWTLTIEQRRWRVNGIRLRSFIPFLNLFILMNEAGKFALKLPHHVSMKRIKQ
jgi:hypothetical protein